MRRDREFAELLVRIADVYADADRERHKAQRENAKLRELVRIVYYCNLPWKDCDKCAMNGAQMDVKISDVAFCDEMYDRMRELGIEVGGA